MSFVKKDEIYMKIITIFLLIIVVFYFNKVDNDITETDKQYIKKYLKNIEIISQNRTFIEEINFINKIQNSVLSVSKKKIRIPFGRLREPKSVYMFRVGTCVERSRVIEKILRFSGFQTRHIAVYSTDKTKSKIMSLLTPGIPSHSVTEVLSSEGWMVIGSNYPWVALDSENNSLSMYDIQYRLESIGKVNWKYTPSETILSKPLTYVYGLYSRHGKFYPPYNFIPDIEWSEFIYNFTEL